ncbi:MAG: urease accessory protein [Pseudohongiellaceae bacterium]|jgi:urease accessory protein
MFVTVYERLDQAHGADDQIILDHDHREKGRFKIISKNGVEVRVFLKRGKALLVGECLKTECGQIIEVVGALEVVTEASCSDWERFSKACYHLGNRHVKIQVLAHQLRIKPDYVLEEMLQLLGLTVTKKTAVFIPELGAYAPGYTGHHHHDHEH